MKGLMPFVGVQNFFFVSLSLLCLTYRVKYEPLIFRLASSHSSVAFVNLSLGSLGIFGPSSKSFIEICNELCFDKKHLHFFLNKLTYILPQK